MYNRIFIFLFLALHAALSINQQKTSKIKFSEKLIVPKLSNGCKNIQCPTQEDPVCVEIKFNKNESANKTLHIIMLNKCEIQYTKCHQGLEAIVVPMSYCKHEILSISGKRRFKREIEAKLPRVSSTTSEEEDGSEAFKVTRFRRSRSKSNKKFNKTKQKTEKKDTPKKAQPKAMRQGDKSSDHLTDNDNNVETEHELSHNDNDDASFHDDNEYVTQNDTENNELENKRADEVQAIIKEAEADCPKQCPIRDVMVCAKCQHGVYKTFSSVCHMRMYSCGHPDEVLELMSRSPCVLSAPYLKTKNMQSKGRMSELNDKDDILRYIKCRQRAKESVPYSSLEHNRIPQIPLDCNFNKKSKLIGPLLPIGGALLTGIDILCRALSC